MGSINFNLLFEFFLILFGIYLLFSANKMKKTKEPTALLLQDEAAICRDKKGFAAEMEGKLRFFGAVMTVYGCVEAVNEAYLHNNWLQIIGVGILLLVCFWFVVKLRKKKKKYI